MASLKIPWTFCLPANALTSSVEGQRLTWKLPESLYSSVI